MAAEPGPGPSAGPMESPLLCPFGASVGMTTETPIGGPGTPNSSHHLRRPEQSNAALRDLPDVGRKSPGWTQPSATSLVSAQREKQLQAWRWAGQEPIRRGISNGPNCVYRPRSHKAHREAWTGLIRQVREDSSTPGPRPSGRNDNGGVRLADPAASTVPTTFVVPSRATRR